MLDRTTAFVLNLARRFWLVLVKAARKAWHAHRRLVRENAAYAAAIAAGAAAIVGQASVADLITTAVAAGLAIYAAITRGVALR